MRLADRLKLSLVALAFAAPAFALVSEVPELACVQATPSGPAADAAHARAHGGEGTQNSGAMRAGNAMRDERPMPSLQLFGDARAMNRDRGTGPLPPPASTAEPTGWAMLIAGVLVIAAIARRWSSWQVD